MEIFGTIFGIIFMIGMVVIYGAAILKIFLLAIEFLSSSIGTIIFCICIFLLFIYFLSKDISDRGLKNIFISLLNGSGKLYMAFWVYMLFFALITSYISDFIVSYENKAAFYLSIYLILQNIILTYSVCITSIKSKSSFILWRGVAFFIGLILFSLNIFGVYISYKNGLDIEYSMFRNVLREDVYTSLNNRNSIDLIRETIKDLIN